MYGHINDNVKWKFMAKARAEYQVTEINKTRYMKYYVPVFH